MITVPALCDAWSHRDGGKHRPLPYSEDQRPLRRIDKRAAVLAGVFQCAAALFLGLTVTTRLPTAIAALPSSTVTAPSPVMTSTMHDADVDASGAGAAGAGDQHRHFEMPGDTTNAKASASAVGHGGSTDASLVLQRREDITTYPEAGSGVVSYGSGYPKDRISVVPSMSSSLQSANSGDVADHHAGQPQDLMHSLRPIGETVDAVIPKRTDALDPVKYGKLPRRDRTAPPQQADASRNEFGGQTLTDQLFDREKSGIEPNVSRCNRQFERRCTINRTRTLS